MTSSAASSSSDGRIPGSRRESIVFPMPGGPAKQEVVTSGRRDLEHPPGALLAADLGEVGSRRRAVRMLPALGSRGLGVTAEVVDGLPQVAHGHRLDPGKGDLGAGFGGADEALGAVPPRPFRRDERARNGAEPPVESELSDRGVAGEASVRDLRRGFQHREGDRQVEARALLAEVGRRQVDGDPVARELQLGRGDPAADSLLRLLAGPVGEPDDRKRRGAALEMRFDLDAARVETDQGMGDGAREHLAILGNNSCRVRDDFATRFPQASSSGMRSYARRATSTSSKYSPARSPVRRLTCRR